MNEWLPFPHNLKRRNTSEQPLERHYTGMNRVSSPLVIVLTGCKVPLILSHLQGSTVFHIGWRVSSISVILQNIILSIGDKEVSCLGVPVICSKAESCLRDQEMFGWLLLVELVEWPSPDMCIVGSESSEVRRGEAMENFKGQQQNFFAGPRSELEASVEMEDMAWHDHSDARGEWFFW